MGAKKVSLGVVDDGNDKQPNRNVLLDDIGSRIYCDVTDVVFYLRRYVHMSGIQRVIFGLIRSLIDGRSQFSDRVFFVVVDPTTGNVNQTDSAFLFDIIEMFDRGVTKRENLDRVLDQLESSIKPMKAEPGDIYLILGAFWIFTNTASVMIKMRRKGLRCGVCVHDIIAISHPEYCDIEMSKGFSARFFEMCSVLDFALTFSSHVKHEVETYLKQVNLENLPVVAVPLAHQFGALDYDTGASLSGPVQDLIKGEYVLCVGTIEVRKNHLYLVNIWRRLMKNATTRVPKLVFVGRLGWRVRDLMDQLEASNYLDRNVVILSDVSDRDLDALYRNCLFTAFPSFVEGWGLPVGESLVHGKVCVASNTTSIPEVGGDHIIYIDPYNLTDGYEKIACQSALNSFQATASKSFQLVRPVSAAFCAA
jgi:glycosyltransferase involved in cell wall biosynthesis